MSKSAPLPENCLNCGAALQGHWCHECGQKAKSNVRHFGSVLTDILDTVFEYDNRIWRTLIPLYLSPGKISTDFMAGRRVRYVLPFRLFFVLSVVMFLTLQFSAMPERITGLNLMAEDRRFDRLNSEDEVIAERNRLIFEMESGLQELAADSGAGGELARSGMRTAIRVVNEAADARIAALRTDEPQPEQDRADPFDENLHGDEVSDTDSNSEHLFAVSANVPEHPQAPTSPQLPAIAFMGGQAWHPETNPLLISWLPAQVNVSINSGIERALINLPDVGENPARLIEAMLSLLPLVLFFMMPVFALLLKIFYLFSRRPYMEHIIVALHSHSFLFFAVLISLLLNALSGIAALPIWLSQTLGRVYWVSLIWIPVYLFLMQRRVYTQGWIFTFVKYNAIGILYAVMLFFALLAAAAISLINL